MFTAYPKTYMAATSIRSSEGDEEVAQLKHDASGCKQLELAWIRYSQRREHKYQAGEFTDREDDLEIQVLSTKLLQPGCHQDQAEDDHGDFCEDRVDKIQLLQNKIK